MTKDEYIEWAAQLINKAIEIMTGDQISEWEGVRAWQEYEIDEEKNNG